MSEHHNGYWILLALALIFFFTLNAYSLPVTTFESFQISGTTDQNITLTCVDDINGCKAINYNIDNNIWIYLTDKTNFTLLEDFEDGNKDRWTNSNLLTLINNTTMQGNYYVTYNTAYGDIHQDFLESELLDFNFIIRANNVAGTNIINLEDSSGNNIINCGLRLSQFQCNDIELTNGVATPSNNTNYIFNIKYNKDNPDANIFVYDANGTTILKYELNRATTQVAGTPATRINLAYANGTMGFDYLYNGGKDININSYSFLYSGTYDHNIQYFSTDNSDNNEAIKTSQFPMFTATQDQSNSRIILTGVNTYNGYTVTSWQYQINGTPITGTTDRIKYYSTNANLDLNVCLTTNSTDTYCQSVLTWDTINPTIDANINASSYGFTSTFDINYNMICYDNLSPINYNIVWNNGTTNTTLYSNDDANATLVSNLLDLNAGQQAQLIFICTDNSNNTAVYTSPIIYALQFRLINELTGNLFDLNKVTNAEAYTYDGNYIYNFKDTNTDTQSFFSPTNTIRFDFTYPDESATKISREINFAYVDDINIPICVAEYQQFYLYRFLSTSEKPIILFNDFADCYSLASTTKFLYNTYLSNTAYTINKPYYLYTYSNGVKSLLALLDGANNTEINLDILAFNQTDYDYSVQTDNLMFRPSDSDLNTVVFYYFSSTNNTSVKIDIYNEDDLIWTYTELTDTNSFQVNFYYADLDINSDDLLKIVVTKVSEGETTSFYKYFNTKSEVYSGILNPFVAIVMSFFIMFFGITMVSYRYAMGWFGIVISLIAIGILALAPTYDYIIFLQAIYLIVGLFIGVIGKEQTLGVQ